MWAKLTWPIFLRIKDTNLPVSYGLSQHSPLLHKYEIKKFKLIDYGTICIFGPSANLCHQN